MKKRNKLFSEPIHYSEALQTLIAEGEAYVTERCPRQLPKGARWHLLRPQPMRAKVAQQGVEQALHRL